MRRLLLGLVWLASIILLFVANHVLASELSSLQLPLDQTVLKIELNEDGVYAITAGDLVSAGFDVDTFNPHNAVLMTRGQAVATQFDGDEDVMFEAGERILFFGRKFQSTREEMQFVTSNVYWLWQGDSANAMPSIASEVGGADVSTFSAEITIEPENVFSLTNTPNWNDFDNEFDAWYWAQLSKSSAGIADFNFDISLPHVVSDTGSADILVELLSQKTVTRSVSMSLNGQPATSVAFDGLQNLNLTQTISQTALVSGTNSLSLSIDSTASDKILLNRATIQFAQELTAIDDELQFGHADAGQFTFHLAGFSSTDAANVLVWDITDPNWPLQIELNAQVSEEVRFGRNQTTNAQYIATTQANIHTPDTVSTYHVADLTPENGAEWVAVAHGDFVTTTQTLAEHRAIHSDLSTHVVAVEDVMNQFGYGLPLPSAIRDYMAHGWADWETQPAYLVLVGDATFNPRQLHCTTCSSSWDTAEKTFIPSYLRPIDRSMGLAPSDHPFTLLAGDDHTPEIAIGRLPVKNSAELNALIGKIITFENNLKSVADWSTDVQFISDNLDAAGNFCAANALDSEELPTAFKDHQRCLNGTGYADVNQLRTDMFDRINEGVLFNQYLGHGFVDGWASEGILTKDDLGQFQNAGKPFVQISGACLDGHFAWTGRQSTGEALLTMPEAGSVAHWGATGLGYLSEHRLLHDGFYEAVFEEGVTAIGDAIKVAKTRYFDQGLYVGQAYSSTLLGDPAMQLIQPNLGLSAFRASVEPIEVGTPFTHVVQLTNQGLLPVRPIVETKLPAGVVAQAVQADGAAQVEIVDGQATIHFTDTLNLNQTSFITFTLEVVDPAAVGSGFTFTVDAQSNALDANPVDNYLDQFIQVGQSVVTAVQLANLSVDGGLEANSFGRIAALLLLLTAISLRATTRSLDKTS